MKEISIADTSEYTATEMNNKARGMAPGAVRSFQSLAAVNRDTIPARAEGMIAKENCRWSMIVTARYHDYDLILLIIVSRGCEVKIKSGSFAFFRFCPDLSIMFVYYEFC